MLETLKKYRMDLHQIPEIGFKEFKTSKYIYNHIKNMPCHIDKVETGYVLFFDNGYSEAIGFRTDIDALPLKEETNLAFASKNGCMHACGHDGHMAMMLGLCDYLALNYKKYDKNIVVVFQPSEEIFGGALSIINSGLLKKYNVKALFGTHIWPGLKNGVIYTRKKEMMARSLEVDINILGKQTHAASAEKGADALRSGVYFSHLMYEYIDSMPKDIYKLFKIGEFKSGTIRNIISGESNLYATMRGYSDDVIDKMKNKLYEIKDIVDSKFKTKTTITIRDGGYPPVINDSNLVDKIKSVSDILLMDLPVMQAEDFGNYSKYIPSVFMFLGTDGAYPLHSSLFDFDMDILQEGLKNYIRILDIKL